jgi:hypothetical protein
MFGDGDEDVVFLRPLAVQKHVAVVAKRSCTCVAMHRCVAFPTCAAGWWCTSSPWEQLQSDHIIQQCGSRFGGWAAAGWACEHTLCCTIPLHLDCTPTAGLVEARVKLQQEERKMSARQHECWNVHYARKGHAATHHWTSFGWLPLKQQLAVGARVLLTVSHR